jgi:ammonia channel protein AmtB
MVGGTLIWIGWYSFNGGSALADSTSGQSSEAILNTHIAGIIY